MIVQCQEPGCAATIDVPVQGLEQLDGRHVVCLAHNPDGANPPVPSGPRTSFTSYGTSEAGDKEYLLNVRMSVVEAERDGLRWRHHDYRRGRMCANEWVMVRTECAVCGRYRLPRIACDDARGAGARLENARPHAGDEEALR